MTTLATASSLAEVLTAESLTRARRRLLTVSPNPTRANTPTSRSLTDDQLRVLAASDWAPPRMTTLDANTFATADTVTRALLGESVRETLERRLAAERPYGTYDDTRAGHDAFSRGVTDDYDHGNHHLARATIRLTDPGLVTRAGLSHLGLPGTDAIDTIAAAAINTGARVTDLTAQYIDDEKALASVGIDPWSTLPSDDPTGQADRILYVGRDGVHIHVKAGRIIVDAPGALPATSVSKISVTRIARRDEASTSPTRPLTCTPGGVSSQACAPSRKSWVSKARAPTPTSTRSPRAFPLT